VGLATLAVSLPLTAVDSRPGVRTGALVGVIVMAAWWVMGYRRRGFIWFADLVAAVALAAIATGLSNPAQVLCSYFVALCYRALFGQKRDISFAGLVIAGSYAATVVTGNGWDSPSLLGQHLMPAALLLLAAPVLHGVTARLHAHERAGAASQILADAGVALLSSGSQRRIAVTASSAARRLLAAHKGYRVAFAVVEDEQLVDIDEHGTAGRPLPLQALPDAVRASLSRAVPFATLSFSADSGGLLSPRPLGSESLVVPLVSQDLLRGAFVLSRPDGSVDAEATGAILQQLAAYVTLALESAGLTDELLASETRFRSLVQNCSDMIAVVDRGGAVRYLSPTVTRVLAMRRPHCSALRWRRCCIRPTWSAGATSSPRCSRAGSPFRWAAGCVTTPAAGVTPRSSPPISSTSPASPVWCSTSVTSASARCWRTSWFTEPPTTHSPGSPTGAISSTGCAPPCRPLFARTGSPCCSSTSTTSRPSMTPSVTRRATASCSTSPPGCGPACAPGTWPPACRVTSSPCCWRASSRAARPLASASACWLPSPSRSWWSASRCGYGPASGSRSGGGGRGRRGPAASR